MWNEFLDEAKSDRKFYNTPVLVLGHKHSGKRSLVDSLLDVSKTTLNSKKISTNYTSGKMKLKGLAPILDYSYLNVLDLNDPDYSIYSQYLRNSRQIISIYGGRPKQALTLLPFIKTWIIEESCSFDYVGFYIAMEFYGAAQ